MYFLIQGRKIISVEEIAKKLEVSTRMVKEYRKDLEYAGIYIGSKLGRYGGYYLENKRSLEGVSCTNAELSALKMARETIKSGKYQYGTQFEILASKILNSKNYMEIEYYHNISMQQPDEIIEKEKILWTDINIAINQNRKINMKYKSLGLDKVQVKERVVDPYGIFDYKGATYFYGYCNRSKDIRFFKLSRILEYKVCNEKFDSKLKFDFDEVKEKSFGIYTDKQIDLKLKIHYPMSEIVKEQRIAKNQKITQLDEKTIYFEAKMSGYTEIKTWVMSMGSKVEVIEPMELKEDILNEIKSISNIYK
jgi:predicted DNA-binding transcriptional regulator YafY